MKIAVDHIDRMKRSPIRNYAIPGLTSWLITDPSPLGCIRLFEMERDHQEPIVPHSHRFGFRCCVLAGEVVQRLWVHPEPGEDSDPWWVSRMRYRNEGPGTVEIREIVGIENFRSRDTPHFPGGWYSMTKDEIHSIYFAKGSKVLFFEGPNESDTSVVLEPESHGRVPTYRVEPWMFQRASTSGVLRREETK